MTDKATENEKDSMKIHEFLMSVRDGGALEELRDSLQNVNRAVTLTGKPGEVCLKIKVKPNGTAKVMIKDELTAKIPQPGKEDTLYFVTDEGGLSRRDPKQLRMDDLEKAS